MVQGGGLAPIPPPWIRLWTMAMQNYSPILNNLVLELEKYVYLRSFTDFIKTLLTQIWNIRKMTLLILYTVVCFKTCESFSAHMSPSPFRPLPPTSLHLLALSQLETLKTNHNPVSTLAPSCWWFRYQANCRHCLHLAPQCSRVPDGPRVHTLSCNPETT